MKLACGRCWDRDCKCSAQELKEYNSVKEKMYSRDEVERLIWRAVVSSGGRKKDLGTKWIKENL